MKVAVSLPRFPFSHFFQPKGNLDWPLLVYHRQGANHENGSLLEVSQEASQYMPDEQKKASNIHYLLANTLVTHWKPFNSLEMEQTLPLLGHVAWVSLLPLIHYGEPTDSYRPPIVVGWRPKSGMNTQIEGGVTNSNCFPSRPLLKTFRVVFKKQKGSLVERILPMLEVMKTIQRNWFDNSGKETPDWVTTAILAGNIKYDKKRHTTSATWLVYPQHADKLEEAVHDEVADATVDVLADIREY